MTSIDLPLTRLELTQRHLPVLDSYRALAATAVVVTHVGFETGVVPRGFWGAVVSRLDLGVALFFALSGFLLFRPWSRVVDRAERPPRTRGYLWHRALRILPAYWIVVVLALAVLPENSSATPNDLFHYLTLTQIYVPGTEAQGLTQMWSLATEVAFYLALPALGLLAAGTARHPAARRIVPVGLPLLLVTLNVAWTLWIHQGAGTGIRSFWLPSFTSWFAVGIALAFTVTVVERVAVTPAGGHGAVVRRLLDAAARPGACWAAAGGLFLLATTPLAGPRAFEALPTPEQAVTKNLLYAAIVACVLLPATLGPTTGRFHRTLSVRPLRRLGDISYGTFLWHLIVLEAVLAVTGRHEFSGGFWPVLLETLVGTTLVATASWLLLERRLLRLKRVVPV